MVGMGVVTPGNRKTVIKCWVIALIIYEMFLLYDYDILPRISYWKYINNSDNYIELDATVVAEREEWVCYLNTFPMYKIFQVKLEYQINGYTFHHWTVLYSDYSEGDYFKIAVSEDNFYDIERLIPHRTSKYAKRLYFKYILFDVVLAILLGIWWVSDKKKQREMLLEYNLKHGEITRFAQQEKKEKDNIILMKEKILEYVHKNIENSEDHTNIDLSKYQNNDIHLNQGSLWYITKVSCYDITSTRLFLTKCNNGEYEAISKTLELRKNGLPEDYYVVDTADTFYYCCRESSERLYAYSKAVGVTNTKYASIYDYIVEQIDCNEKASTK